MEFTLKSQQWPNIDELKLSRVGMPRILYAIVGAQFFKKIFLRYIRMSSLKFLNFQQYHCIVAILKAWSLMILLMF